MVRFGAIYYSQIHTSFLNPLHADNWNKWGGTGRVCDVYDGVIRIGSLTESVMCNGHETRTHWHPTRGIIEDIFGEIYRPIGPGYDLDTLIDQIRIAAKSGTDKLGVRKHLQS